MKRLVEDAVTRVGSRDGVSLQAPVAAITGGDDKATFPDIRSVAEMVAAGTDSRGLEAVLSRLEAGHVNATSCSRVVLRDAVVNARISEKADRKARRSSAHAPSAHDQHEAELADLSVFDLHPDGPPSVVKTKHGNAKRPRHGDTSPGADGSLGDVSDSSGDDDLSVQQRRLMTANRWANAIKNQVDITTRPEEKGLDYASFRMQAGLGFLTSGDTLADMSKLFDGKRTAKLERKRARLLQESVLHKWTMADVRSKIAAVGDLDPDDYHFLFEESTRIPDAMPSTAKGLAGIGELPCGIPPRPGGLTAEAARILTDTEAFGEGIRVLTRLDLVTTERLALSLQDRIVSLEPGLERNAMFSELNGIVDRTNRMVASMMQLLMAHRSAATSNREAAVTGISVIGTQEEETRRAEKKIRRQQQEAGVLPSDRGSKSPRSSRGPKGKGGRDRHPGQQPPPSNPAGRNLQHAKPQHRAGHDSEPKAKRQQGSGTRTGLGGGASAGGGRGRTSGSPGHKGKGRGAPSPKPRA